MIKKIISLGLASTLSVGALFSCEKPNSTTNGYYLRNGLGKTITSKEGYAEIYDYNVVLRKYNDYKYFHIMSKKTFNEVDIEDLYK